MTAMRMMSKKGEVDMEINEILAQLKSLDEQANQTIASMKHKESQMFEKYYENLTNKIKKIYEEISPLLQIIMGDEKYRIILTDRVYGTQTTPIGYELVLAKNEFDFGQYGIFGFRSTYMICSDFNGFTEERNTQYVREQYKMLVDNWDAWKETVFTEFTKQYTERIEKKLAYATESFNIKKEKYTFKEGA